MDTDKISTQTKSADGLNENPERTAPFRKSKPELIRLEAHIHTVREIFNGYMARSAENADKWWADCARRSLRTAQAASAKGDLDGGWTAVHDAERFMVFGMSPEELLAKAASLSAEAQGKLKGWRAIAIKQLFAPVALHDWFKDPASHATRENDKITFLQHVVVEALGILHDYSDNIYHRLHLAGKQLRWLVIACGLLLLTAFTLAYLYAPEADLNCTNLVAVALSGAFGGVVSAMYQLSRVGTAKIPEALLHGFITSGRPLVGAAAALFVYVGLKSDIISLVQSADVTLFSALVLGFAAGFSERFVLGTVAKVTGAADADKTESTK